MVGAAAVVVGPIDEETQMKVAVTSRGPSLESTIDPLFGRARYLLVLDTDTGEFTAEDNTENLHAPQGGEVLTAEAVVSLGVKVVLAGSIGPKAYATLEAAGINVCTGRSGPARDAIEHFKSGRLNPVTKPNVAGRWA